MDCPACKGVMVIAEYKRIEVDYCTACAGVWFDAGELELLLDSAGLADSDFTMERIASLPAVETAEKPRKCPICGKRMRKVLVGSGPQVMVDACVRGDGLWFDGGELDHIVEQIAREAPAEGAAQPVLISFLGELFKSSL